jgi:hypothetical protein
MENANQNIGIIHNRLEDNKNSGRYITLLLAPLEFINSF